MVPRAKLLTFSSERQILRAALDVVENPVFVKDDQHRVVTTNRAGCLLLARPIDQILGRTDRDFMPAQQAERHFATDQQILETGKPEQYEETLTDASGRVRNLLTRKCLFQDSRGQKFIFAHITDVTEFRRAEAQIRYSMEHDGLTGLANSTLFRNRLSQLLTREPKGHLPSIVLVDLDRFRNINDAFGRSTGDSLLVQFAQRLAAHAHPGDLVARIGSDEFAIVSRTAIQRAAVDRFAAAVLDDLNSAPFAFNGHRIHLSASIGIATARENEDVEALHRRAELALRQAKLEGRSRRRFFEAELEAPTSSGPHLEHDLRNAIQQRQFSVVYQPFARVSDLAILGYEALLRWAHPVYGQITPSVFIPLAESEGFIVAIGEWVLREACKQAAEGPRELTVAVNVSPIQFTRADLPTLVQAVVSESGIAPQRIELEITESAVIGDLDRARRTFAGLREIGVAVVLDDFGSGYSSLEILKSLPFDKIKIDRSLLKEVGSKPEANAIISAILRLTHTLGLRVVAEGVETSQQLDVLRLEHCDTFQGFLLGQPITNPFRRRA